MSPELDAILDKSPVWRQLYETNPKYRKLWDEGKGPGQNGTPPAPYEACPHYQEGACEIASEVAHTRCETNDNVCRSCTRDKLRSRRLNRETLTLAVLHNPTMDISAAESVIDNVSTGFGTRLANTVGLFIRSTPTCGCAGHQDILDTWTPDYIRENLDKVLDWLHNEAKTRKMPFSRILVRTLLLGLLATQSEQLPNDPR